MKHVTFIFECYYMNNNTKNVSFEIDFSSHETGYDDSIMKVTIRADEV